MAQIHLETILFKLSKLVKDGERPEPGTLYDQELHQAITALIEEHLGPTVLVETDSK